MALFGSETGHYAGKPSAFSGAATPNKYHDFSGYCNRRRRGFPWADNDGSLASKFFGGFFVSKRASQREVASAVSTTP